MHAETKRRIRQGINDRKNILCMTPTSYPHHQPFIPDGLTPNMDERRRRYEPWGLHYPSPGREPPARRHYQLEMDDWSDERIVNYSDDHAEGIARFKEMESRRLGPQLRRRGMRYWARNYHEYILDLQGRDEYLRLQTDHAHDGRGRGLGGNWRVNDLYHGGYGLGPHHMDDEDEEEEDS